MYGKDKRDMIMIYSDDDACTVHMNMLRTSQAPRPLSEPVQVGFILEYCNNGRCHENEKRIATKPATRAIMSRPGKERKVGGIETFHDRQRNGIPNETDAGGDHEHRDRVAQAADL
jgi:hypothetical protein